jgi:hypothetical protein
MEFSMNPFGTPTRFTADGIVYRYKVVGRYIYTTVHRSISEQRKMHMTLSSIEGVQRLLNDYVWVEVNIRDRVTGKDMTSEFNIRFAEVEKQPRIPVLKTNEKNH